MFLLHYKTLSFVSSVAHREPDMANIYWSMIINVVFLVKYTISKESDIEFNSVGLKPVIQVQNISKVGDAGNKLYVLDFVGLVQKHGYPAEEHTVVTEDGYKLRLHRIPGSPSSPATLGKPAVLVQHGVLASSDSWVIAGPPNGLPFALADTGYDAWVGNARGNTYGKSHKTLNVSDERFWDFSFHEIGTRDLPAMIDYILSNTREKKVHYVGHSMGTTVSYILLSEKPEYNEKMNLVVSLAPVAFWRHRRSYFERFLIHILPFIQTLLKTMKVNEVFPQNGDLPKLAKLLCRGPINPCKTIVKKLAGEDFTLLNNTMLPFISRYYPAGGSTKTLWHYWQNMSSRTFRQYDEGVYKNFKKYGRLTPLSYNVTKVTAPVALIYGLNDPISTQRDSEALAAVLPHLVTMEPVAYLKFNHADFQWGSEAKRLVHDRVIDLMKMYDQCRRFA